MLKRMIINNICLSESGDLFVTTTNSRSGVEETRNIKDIIHYTLFLNYMLKT